MWSNQTPSLISWGMEATDYDPIWLIGLNSNIDKSSVTFLVLDKGIYLLYLMKAYFHGLILIFCPPLGINSKKELHTEGLEYPSNNCPYLNLSSCATIKSVFQTSWHSADILLFSSIENITKQLSFTFMGRSIDFVKLSLSPNIAGLSFGLFFIFPTANPSSG